MSDEIYKLQKQKIGINIFKPKDYGFDFYSGILFTSKSEITYHKNRAINFKNASLKGWKYAFSHIEETIALIKKKYNSQNKTKQALMYEAKELKKLAYLGTNKIGKLDKNKIKNIYGTYALIGFVNGKFDVDDFVFDVNNLFFNEKEKRWIQNHPILKYSEINWKPLSIIENGKMNGIMGDYLDLISKYTGIEFKYVAHTKWENVLKDFKNGNLDILPSTPENNMMKKPEESILKLNQLRKMGIKIAIDDFGTGYSSLSYLKRLPIDTLKIDQSFIKDILTNDDDEAIVKAIIALAHSLNLNLIAEGVETTEQKEFLLLNGCKNIQGYLYSKPIPNNEFEKLFLRNNNF